jgi:prevent-host-death family protein
MIWQLQDAKNKFSELVDTAIHKGPQTVTKHGEETVVFMSVRDYRKLAGSRRSISQVFAKASVYSDDLDLDRDKSEKLRDLTL